MMHAVGRFVVWLVAHADAGSPDSLEAPADLRVLYVSAHSNGDRGLLIPCGTCRAAIALVSLMTEIEEQA